MLKGLLAAFFMAGSALIANCQYKVKIQLSAAVMAQQQEDLYAAGSFNGWNPADKKMVFVKQGDGTGFLELQLDRGVYEFKITRGSWDKTECDEQGGEVPNRILSIDSDTAIQLNIRGWRDQFTSGSKKSTAGRTVHIIDTAFYMPQLGRSRRIWIYLPEEYEHTRKRYPVLYMHDGQNVFEDSSSYSGEWGVDEALDTLGAQWGSSIVVAIDNGTYQRLNEYCPYDFDLSGIAANYKSGKGEGKQYVDFIVKTLMPFIEKQYRVKKGKKNTTIAGSSMGGLISMYAILAYPKVFGTAGVFSPAFWVGPSIFKDIQQKGHQVKGRIFFYAGMQEGESMVPNTLKAFEEMKKVSKAGMTVIIRAQGLHNEQRWREEFPGFYQWEKKK